MASMFELLEQKYGEAQRKIGQLELRLMHVSRMVKHLGEVELISPAARDELLRALGEK